MLLVAGVVATSAPGELSNLYVVEQAGRIMVLRNGALDAVPRHPLDRAQRR